MCKLNIINAAGTAILNLNTKFQAIFKATDTLLSDKEYLPLGDEVTHAMNVLHNILDQQEDRLQTYSRVVRVRKSLFV